MAIRARFKGAMHSPRPGEPAEPTEFLQGIPARDLSDEDFDALPVEYQEMVRDSALYELTDRATASSTPATPAEHVTEVTDAR